MKSRIASIATVLAIAGGTTGAMALASTGSPRGPNGGAAAGQYWPGKGCGDANHVRQTPDKACPGSSSADRRH